MKVLTYRHLRDAATGLISGKLRSFFVQIFVCMLLAEPAFAATAPYANIKQTKHNLSSSGTGSIKASSETQVCVFCHTPHAATSGVAPLWNKSVSTTGYTRYTSSSLDVNSSTDYYASQPAGSSILCLSCHDGQVAIGNIGVLNGQSNVSITLSSPPNSGKMPLGSGANSGYTRNLGTDLTNDHPISITYNNAVATADGELQGMTTTNPQQRDTLTGDLIGIRDASSGYKPTLPLQATGSVSGSEGRVQCSTCHDPHRYDPDEATNGPLKFLRLNRLQRTQAPNGTFNETYDIICLACHTKQGSEWANSAHANSTVADEAYTSTAATQRQFPSGTKVWQAACLNCHDTHTEKGARRLLREGNDNGGTPKSAIENTCYQCHTSTGDAARVIGTASGSTVPDIKTEFGRTVRMPIIDSDQGGGGNTTEKHDITNANFEESATLLGAGNTGNRHVECPDCHNPHRVIRNEVFDGSGSSSNRTHIVSGTTANSGADGNLASGVLRGIWGVEPTYDALSSDWPERVVGMTVKKGVPGGSTARSSAWLTREYQLCLKCHSDYANGATAASFPNLRGNTYGGTASNKNSVTKYTNVAGELSVGANDSLTGADQGEYGETNAGVGEEDNIAPEPTGSYPADTLGPGMPSGSDVTGTQNHRSWHPVMFPTGRTRDERRMYTSGTGDGNFRVPFNDNVGRQTMHCSDCHGNSGGVNANATTTSGNTWQIGVGPVTTMVQGPHGSTVTSDIGNFLLKGEWGTGVTVGDTAGLCINCHNPTINTSGAGNGTARSSGFTNATDGGCSDGGGHGGGHAGKPCVRCHIAVPHGWKNKAFLVNLNCTGDEIGQTSCYNTTGYGGVPDANADVYTNGPYYLSAFLRVAVWQASGNWREDSCGSSQGDSGKEYGKDWMTNGGKC